MKSTSVFDQRHDPDDDDAAGPDDAEKLLDTDGLPVEQVAQRAADADHGVERLGFHRVQVREIQNPIVVHKVQNAEIAHVVSGQCELHLGDIRDHQPAYHGRQLLREDAGPGPDLQHLHVGRDVALQHIHVDEKAEFAAAATR